VGTGLHTFLSIGSTNADFNGDVVNISSTGADGSSTALRVLAQASADNYAVYIDNANEGWPLVVVNSSGTGNGHGVLIDNTGSVNPALEIADNGGSVKLSYEALTVSGNAATISPDVSVVYIESDNDGTDDVIAMPAGIDGEFLYVVYAGTDNASFGTIYTTTQNASLTFVYAGGAWHLISVVE